MQEQTKEQIKEGTSIVDLNLTLGSGRLEPGAQWGPSLSMRQQ